MYYLYCKYTKDLHEVDVLVNSIIINSSINNTGVICESLLLDVQRPHYYFHFFIFPTVRPYLCTYSVFRKNCAFSQFTATPPSPTFKVLNAVWMYSHSYWLTFFVQPIAAECWRGRRDKLSGILGEKNTWWTPCTLKSLRK